MIPASFPLPACLTADSLARLARAYPQQVAGALLALPQGAAVRAWDCEHRGILWESPSEVDRLMRQRPNVAGERVPTSPTTLPEKSTGAV